MSNELVSMSNESASRRRCGVPANTPRLPVVDSWWVVNSDANFCWDVGLELRPRLHFCYLSRWACLGHRRHRTSYPYLGS